MDDNNSSGEVVKLRIVRDQAGTSPEFSNHFVVQVDGHEYHLRFYQVLPPVLLGGEETERTIESMKGVIEAKCVGHVVLAADRMREYVDMVVDHARKHLNWSEKPPKGDDK